MHWKYGKLAKGGDCWVQCKNPTMAEPIALEDLGGTLVNFGPGLSSFGKNRRNSSLPLSQLNSYFPQLARGTTQMIWMFHITLLPSYTAYILCILVYKNTSIWESTWKIQESRFQKLG